jgi:hypothetical protein
LPPDAFEDLTPDELHFHEATGNEGASFERTYRRAGFVLWPATRRLAVVNLPDDRRTAQDQLFGCQLDQIVQHAPAQGDLTCGDQMVVIAERPPDAALSCPSWSICSCRVRGVES